ncbi:MAG: hypothetical protein QOF26_73, partial [Baekduia sp.]|nr:hypothetical protein [Baekduia sp.]
RGCACRVHAMTDAGDSRRHGAPPSDG